MCEEQEVLDSQRVTVPASRGGGAFKFSAAWYLWEECEADEADGEANTAVRQDLLPHGQREGGVTSRGRRTSSSPPRFGKT